jgi:hypothetical protein
MNNLTQTFITAVILSLLTINLQAQSTPESGSIGLRATITGQTAIEVPYMLNEQLSIAPFLGINATENQSTNFSIGVRPRYYVTSTTNFGTYATGVIGITNTSISNTNNSITDFNFGLGYGGEYFFSKQFSVSADGNLMTRFGNSSNNISTMARISATIYF